MKKLASILFMFVLLHSQAFAYVGGPFDARNNETINVVGTYAAVMIPTNINDVRDEAGGEEASSVPEDFVRRSSIGLFALNVVGGGLAEGVVVIFDNGRIFSGVAGGFADPDSGDVFAILNASAGEHTVTGFPNPDFPADPDADPTIDVDFEPQAVGSVEATISNQYTGLFQFGLSRLEGTAEVAINNGFIDLGLNEIMERVIEYAVDGVKQTDANTEMDEFDFNAR